MAYSVSSTLPGSTRGEISSRPTWPPPPLSSTDSSVYLVAVGSSPAAAVDSSAVAASLGRGGRRRRGRGPRHGRQVRVFGGEAAGARVGVFARLRRLRRGDHDQAAAFFVGGRGHDRRHQRLQQLGHPLRPFRRARFAFDFAARVAGVREDQRERRASSSSPPGPWSGVRSRRRVFRIRRRLRRSRRSRRPGCARSRSWSPGTRGAARVGAAEGGLAAAPRLAEFAAVFHVLDVGAPGQFLRFQLGRQRFDRLSDRRSRCLRPVRRRARRWPGAIAV